jgi:hypothetical protein
MRVSADSDAVGAVANACAESPIVLAISGDRVVRTGGAARLSKQEPEFGSLLRSVSPSLDRRKVTVILTPANGENRMNKEEGNKAVVGRWFTEFWGKDVNLAVVDEIAAPDMLLKLLGRRAAASIARAVLPINSRAHSRRALKAACGSPSGLSIDLRQDHGIA